MRVSDVMEEVGARLHMARLRAGMTHEDVAAATGYFPSTVAKIERGEGSPRMEVLIRMAEAVDTSWRWLLTGLAEPLTLLESSHTVPDRGAQADRY